MSDVFISYASADRDKARLIASVLEPRGYSVWWDRTIPPGRVFDEVIQEALNSAKCAIVLWSKTSVKSNWVKTEAGEAENRGILVPAMIESTPLPLEFKRIQTADLSHWDGEPDHPELRNLVASVEQFLKGGASSPRASVMPSVRRSIARPAVYALAALIAIGAGWAVYERVIAHKPATSASNHPSTDSLTPSATRAEGGQPSTARVTATETGDAKPPMGALIAQTDFGKGRKRINLLSPENGGQVLVAASDAWAKVIDSDENASVYIDNGEGVFAFKDEQPAIFDMFTVLIKETNEFNLNEFELLSGNESPLGRFDSIGKFKTQNGKLFKTPFQEFGFPAVRARYLKVKSLSNHRNERNVVYAYEFQLLGNLE
ncbi:MAG: toll/interleukin-1 receptor domain-containing protein [Burkholderiales bacterium]